MSTNSADELPPFPVARSRSFILFDRCKCSGVFSPIWYPIGLHFFGSFGFSFTSGVLLELQKDQFGANIYWINNGSAILSSLLCAPGVAFIGYLSQPHRLGRKNIMLIAAFTEVAFKAIYLVTLNQYIIKGVSLLFSVTGLTGASVLVPWITDWCHPEDKMAYLGMLMGFEFGFMSASQYLAAFVTLPTKYVFQVTFALSFISPLYLLFVFPSKVPRFEPSTPRSLTRRFSRTDGFLMDDGPSDASPEPQAGPQSPPARSHDPPARSNHLQKWWTHTRVSVKYLFKTRPLVTSIYLIIMFTEAAVGDSVGAFMVRQRGFTPSQFNALMGTIGFGGFVLQCFILPALGACGVTPQFLFIPSVVALVAHFLCYGLLTNKTLLIALEPLGSMRFVSSIAATALISGVEDDESLPSDQGTLLGVLHGLSSWVSCVSPLLFAYVTTYSEEFPKPFNFAGIGFVIAAVIVAFAFPLSLVLFYTSKFSNQLLTEE